MKTEIGRKSKCLHDEVKNKDISGGKNGCALDYKFQKKNKELYVFIHFTLLFIILKYLPARLWPAAKMGEPGGNPF